MDARVFSIQFLSQLARFFQFEHFRAATRSPIDQRFPLDHVRLAHDSLSLVHAEHEESGLNPELHQVGSASAHFCMSERDSQVFL
jgi:hypothetical protein